MGKLFKVSAVLLICGAIAFAHAQTIDLTSTNTEIQIVSVPDVAFESLRREKNALWTGTVLFALSTAIFAALADNVEWGWSFPAAITGTAGAIMAPAAIIRTTVYQRARWEVAHSRNITIRNKSATANRVENQNQRVIIAPHRNLEEIQTQSAEERARQEAFDARQVELRRRWEEQQRQLEE